MTGLCRLTLVYGHLRRSPLAGVAVTRLVRTSKAFWRSLSRFDRRADEIHLLTAAVRDLSAEVDRLGREVMALRALRDQPAEVSASVQAAIQPATPFPAAVALLARTGAEQVEEVTFDLTEADRSGLMARLEACPPSGLAAATIPLSGRETPDVLRDLAGKLVRAMEAHAVLCLRLLDHLSLFLVRPREGVGKGAMQVSPELVRDIFEHQGCRLVGLRRGGAGAVPTLDLILEMREL